MAHLWSRFDRLPNVLVSELVDIARHAGFRRLEAELNGERKIALHVLAQLGFSEG
jgi:hypothetical protein